MKNFRIYYNRLDKVRLEKVMQGKVRLSTLYSKHRLKIPETG